MLSFSSTYYIYWLIKKNYLQCEEIQIFSVKSSLFIKVRLVNNLKFASAKNVFQSSIFIKYASAINTLQSFVFDIFVSAIKSRELNFVKLLASALF